MESISRTGGRSQPRVEERAAAGAAVGVLLCLFALGGACKGEGPKPAPAPSAPSTASPSAERPIVLTQSGELVDDETAAAIGTALHDLQHGPAEPATKADEAARKDPKALLGTWSIRHTINRTDGEASPPAPPLVPTTWTFAETGSLSVEGGMALDLRYTYTGDRLVVTGLGPRQDYAVDELSDSTLKVTMRIEAGTLVIENTTVLDRK